AFVRAPPGDGFPEPWAHAGRHHGDPRLARYCVRGNRPVINLSGRRIDRGPHATAADTAQPVEQCCKFTKEGEVRLRARKVANGRDWIELAVADSGIGMTPEHTTSSTTPW